jgi:ligand-binding sensor domain-containing protein
MDYRWKSPTILMESSDNRLWFESENGLVWLDPSEGKWCWFTTVQSNIVEDEEHNLWMIANEKLYKYPLKP